MSGQPKVLKEKINQYLSNYPKAQSSASSVPVEPLIKGDVGQWNLSEIYIKNLNPMFFGQPALQPDKVTEVTTTYQTLAVKRLEASFPKDLDPQATYIAAYILKKRASLVYMSLLYLQKLKESKESKDSEQASLELIQRKLGSLKEMIRNTNSTITWTNATNATNATNVSQQKSALDTIATIQANVQQLLAAKVAEKEQSDNLFKEIIPFIANQSTVEGVPE